MQGPQECSALTLGSGCRKTLEHQNSSLSAALGAGRPAFLQALSLPYSPPPPPPPPRPGLWAPACSEGDGESYLPRLAPSRDGHQEVQRQPVFRTGPLCGGPRGQLMKFPERKQSASLS